MAVGYVNAGLALVQGLVNADAEKSRRKFEKQIAEQNARFKELGIIDAKLKGRKQASQVKANARATVAEQQLAAAAQGLNINTGVAKNLTDETNLLSELDIQTIRNNATREAFGLEVDAFNIGIQDDFNQIASDRKVANTIATAGFQAANSIQSARTSSALSELKAAKGKS